MSTTKVTIEGLFRVVSCAKNDYGTNATIVEAGDADYPQSFLLTLPDGHVWAKGEMARMVLVCQPVTINPKGGSRFMKFTVTDYTKSPVRLVIEDLKVPKGDGKP